MSRYMGLHGGGIVPIPIHFEAYTLAVVKHGPPGVSGHLGAVHPGGSVGLKHSKH